MWKVAKKLRDFFLENSRKYKKLLGNNHQKVEKNIFQCFIFVLKINVPTLIQCIQEKGEEEENEEHQEEQKREEDESEEDEDESGDEDETGIIAKFGFHSLDCSQVKHLLNHLFLYILH